MLDNLPPNTLPRLLRRTTLSAIIVGLVGFIVALLVAPPLSALGVVIGVGLAILNLRYLDRQAARVELQGEQSAKAVRRQLGGKTTGRLAMLTLVVLVVVWLNAPLDVYKRQDHGRWPVASAGATSRVVLMRIALGSDHAGYDLKACLLYTSRCV